MMESNLAQISMSVLLRSLAMEMLVAPTWLEDSVANAMKVGRKEFFCLKFDVFVN